MAILIFSTIVIKIAGNSGYRIIALYFLKCYNVKSFILNKLGYLLTFDDESVSWDGSRCEAECNPLIMTYKDHRIAMAFAPAVTQHQGLTIEDAMVVNKSFPQYWEQMRLMGIIAEKI